MTKHDAADARALTNTEAEELMDAIQQLCTDRQMMAIIGPADDFEDDDLTAITVEVYAITGDTYAPVDPCPHCNGTGEGRSLEEVIGQPNPYHQEGP